jgi:hypothetical protein
VIERGRTPVIMCTWKRIERLARTLEMLAGQEAPATLYIWNNNRAAASRVDELVSRSSIPARSIHCSRNIGGFGRFYLARDLADHHDAAIFIDDDQEFGPSMVVDQLASFAPESLAGWWAFRYAEGARSYAERHRVTTAFDSADYVGTGGMVAHTSVFADPALFRCPRRYWFVEDVWLSYFASHIRGWMLRRSLAEFEFAPDGLDIDLTLAATKVRMFRYLKRRGWSVAASGA